MGPPHLDPLPVQLQALLPEVHPDGRLRVLEEDASAEPVGEARLAHVGVSDHDDLKHARLQGLVHKPRGGGGGGRHVAPGEHGVEAPRGAALSGAAAAHPHRLDMVGSENTARTREPITSEREYASNPIRAEREHKSQSDLSNNNKCDWVLLFYFTVYGSSSVAIQNMSVCTDI